MLAAKEKTISSSPKSTFTWSPRGTYVKAAATHSKTNVYDNSDLRKSEKSPIGLKVKSRSKSPWPNQHSAGKTLGENVVNYDELHWAPGMSQYRAYFTPGGVDPAGEESWDVDDVNCVVTRKIKIGFDFNNTRKHRWEDTKEDPLKRKRKFMTGFKKVVEKAFNSTKFKIHPARKSYKYFFNLRTCKCACPNGLSLKVDIAWTKIENFTKKEGNDYAVEVYPRGTEARRSHVRGDTAHLVESDNQPQTHIGQDGKTEYQQITSVHEFGHLIGLMHPNHNQGSHDIGDRPDYWTPEDGNDEHGRTVAEGDLMGLGMGMRAFYFDAWEKRANKELDAKCGPWKVK